MTVTATAELDNLTRTEVESLLDAAARVDGVAPVSEQGLLRLRAAVAQTRHLVSLLGAAVAGYAQLDVDSASAEVVVHPVRRRRGVGRSLVTALLDATPEVRIWAHGDLPAAAGLAASTGFVRVRSLWQMSRALGADLPVAQLPPGVVVDTFRPGSDDEDWIAVNARAFANHPEQGRLTLTDLRQRLGLPWFDPAGFFVARRAGRMVGFHWTKVHDAGTGEVYVVGVDPDERGNGLGRALTLVGLHRLRGRGLSRVILYVDEDNPAAVRLYAGLGFTRVAVDVMYARPG